MKKQKDRAFSLLEVVVAMAIFAAAIPQIINCFLLIVKTPHVNQNAVALIADVDNCMTNIDKVSGEKVYCMLSESQYTASKSKRTISTIGDKTLNLYTLTISKHQNLKDENATVTAHSYVFE